MSMKIVLVCKIIFTYSVANDIHYVKDAN